MKIHNISLSMISVLFGVSTGIFLSLCVHEFWSFGIAVQIILVSLFSFLGWIICRSTIRIITKRNSGTTNISVRICLLAILSIMLTIILGIKFISHTVYLPPVKLEITLLKDNPNHVKQPKMQLDEILINNKTLSYSDAEISSGCVAVEKGFANNGSEQCRLIFDVDVSRQTDLQLDFMKNQSSGVVELRIKSLTEELDLYQASTEKSKHLIPITPDLSSKRIRFLIIAISLFAMFAMIFLVFTLLDATILRHLDTKEKLKIIRSTLWISVLIYTTFILGAFLYTSGWVGNHPLSFVNLDSDAANIASFSAAYDHPDNFKRDAFLSNPANFRSYFAFHIPLIRTLAKIVGQYSSAFAVLLFPVILLQLIGFYRLGLTLYKNRYIAFLFSWVLAVPVKMPVSEFFGVSLDVIPRFLFQAILPFLLIYIVAKIEQKNIWWVGALLFSASLYIHPVSGPSWLVVYFLSIIFVCKGKNALSWWLQYFGVVILSILGLIPFVLSFFGSSNSDPANMTLLNEITLERLSSQTESMAALYSRYFSTYVYENWTMVILWGISILFLGSVAISIFGFGSKSQIKISEPSKRVSLLIFSWWISITLVSVILPIFDEIYVQKTGNIQILREIRRSMRYFIPLLWMTFFWIFAQISSRIKIMLDFETKRIQYYWMMLAFCFSLLYFGNSNLLNNYAIKNEISCLKQGSIICEVPGNEKSKIEFYDHVTNIVQINELLFPDPSPDYMKDSLIPRYYCLRSIAYTYKDGGSTGNTSMEFIENWWKITNEIAPFLPNSDHPLDLAVLEVAIKTGSDYFILVKTENSYLEVLSQSRIVFENDYGILYSLKE